MKIEQVGEDVVVTRNKKNGLKLKKIVSSISNDCKGCCLKRPNNYAWLRYGRLLTDICNEEKIIFRIAHEDSKG